MKRSLAPLLAFLILALSLFAGCGPQPQAVQPPTPTAQPSLAPTERPAAATNLEQALAGAYEGTSITVEGPYLAEYGNALERFTERTGIEVQESLEDVESRSYTAKIEAGDGADLVLFGSLGSVRGFAEAGKLVDIATVIPIDTLRARYDQPWLDWATMPGPGGPIVAGIWGTAFVNSAIWYPKAAFDAAGYRVPGTWQELIALSDQIVADGGTPWCAENGTWDESTVGWSAQNWISDLLLRTAPPEDYDRWIAGELPFSSPQVRRAALLLSDLWFTPGYTTVERQALNTTYQSDMIPLLFATPPTCWLLKEPGWTTFYDGQTTDTLFRQRAYGEDYAFFLVPPVDPAYGAPAQLDVHITAMFHDRPEVRALAEYLTTAEAQREAWSDPEERAGFSPQREAQLDWYTSARGERALAEAARGAATLRLNAADAMWPATNASYVEAISAYVNGALDLDTALSQIDAAAPPPAP